MDTQDPQKTAPRPEAGKSTLPQPGRPVPSRAYPGALIVVEGTDGSGKSTQLYLLKRWLEIGGYRLHFTEWNSSPLVKSATRRGKQRRLLTPTTFSLLHAADFADRCERQIMPLLQGDYLVLADRYIYTAFARDGARGCPQKWLRNLYRFAPVVAPDASPAPPQPPASAPAKLVSAPDDDSSGAFFAEPLVGFDASEIAGTLIVIEGMDGSGRSTQISLLQEWLESEGFAVQTSGLRRSNLVGRDIDQLLAKNAVTRLTLALMYCTDFFDQLEHRIVPALKSGAVVLADRYIFTLIASSWVRGINRDYF